MFGLNPFGLTAGALCQYELATAGLACRIPDHMSNEEVAALGVVISTTTLLLYQTSDFPVPCHPVPESIPGKGTYVLEQGGSTATGIVAIQLLKRSGLLAIVTCSHSSRDMVTRGKRVFGVSMCFGTRNGLSF